MTFWDKKGHTLKSHIYKVILQSESWHLGLKRANFEISYLQGDIAHCWLEDVQNYKNKSPQNNYIFLIPLNIPDFAASIIFLIHVRLPGGTTIIFAQSWNFELKFFVDNPFMQKINSIGVWSHFLPKNEPKQPKDCNPNIAHCLLKI